MSELWQGLFWGALFSIPIGIAVNLVSPAINRAIARRNSEAAGKQAARDQRFKEEAARLSRDRPALYSVLLEALLRIAYIGALFGVMAGALAVFGQVIQPALWYSNLPFPAEYASTLIFATSQLIGLIGTIIVLNIARQSIVLLGEVRAARNATADSAAQLSDPAPS